MRKFINREVGRVKKAFPTQRQLKKSIPVSKEKV